MFTFLNNWTKISIVLVGIFCILLMGYSIYIGHIDRINKRDFINNNHCYKHISKENVVFYQCEKNIILVN